MTKEYEFESPNPFFGEETGSMTIYLRDSGEPLAVLKTHKETCSIRRRGAEWVCTRCGDTIGSSDPTCELVIDENAIELWEYCPHCGAKVVQ